jgi:hypothetical protein
MKQLILFLLVSLIFSSCELVNSVIPGNENNTVKLYPVLVDGDWGYINNEGKIVLEPDFQNAAPFYDGLAAVRESWGWKYINSKGDITIEGNFNEIRRFSGGKAAVRFDGRWGYINKSGHFVINPKYRSASSFSDGRAFVRSINYSDFYYIDENGDRVESVNTPSDMDYIEENEFRNGRALISDDDLFGYINKNGETIIDLKYPEARPFSDKLAAVKISDRWGFIDLSGQVSISPQYISVGDFGNGLAPARKNSNSFGYINRSGEFAINEKFQQAGTFTEERAPVMINNKWTFIDKDGKQISAPKFDEVEPFHNGLARVTIYDTVGEEIEENYGYINKSGSYVWYPTR